MSPKQQYHQYTCIQRHRRDDNRIIRGTTTKLHKLEEKNKHTTHACIKNDREHATPLVSVITILAWCKSASAMQEQEERKATNTPLAPGLPSFHGVIFILSMERSDMDPEASLTAARMFSAHKAKYRLKERPAALQYCCVVKTPDAIQDTHTHTHTYIHTYIHKTVSASPLDHTVTHE